MHSTRHPPFSPQPLPKEINEKQGGSRVVRLHRNTADSERSPGPASEEPAWRQAFVMGDGVIATRTPDRVIRARSGHPEPAPLGKPVRAADPETNKGSRSSHPAPREAMSELTVQDQIDCLRTAFSADDAVSSQTPPSPARREVPAAETSGRRVK